MWGYIITGAICLSVGAWLGIWTLALVTVSKDKYSERKYKDEEFEDE